MMADRSAPKRYGHRCYSIYFLAYRVDSLRDAAWNSLPDEWRRPERANTWQI